MGLDYVLSKRCAARDALMPGEVEARQHTTLVQLVKKRSWLLGIREQIAKEQGAEQTPLSIKHVVLGPQGPVEQELSLGELEKDKAWLDRAASHCQGCPVAGGEDFGCVGFIRYPITEVAERWLLDQLGAQGSIGEDARVSLSDYYKVPDRGIGKVWRTRPELLEARTGAERIVGKRFFGLMSQKMRGEDAIEFAFFSADPFGNGYERLSKNSAVLLLVAFQAVTVDGVVPTLETLNDLLTSGYDSEQPHVFTEAHAKVRARVVFTMAPAVDECSAMIRSYFEAVLRAYHHGFEVLISA